MRKLMVAGNWKMNKTNAEAEAFAKLLLSETDDSGLVDILIIPPFTSLPLLKQYFRETKIKIGAQNLHWEDRGAYTGEISPLMLTELGDYVLVGHSERRQYFGETNDTVNKKIKAALRHALKPIVCIGETYAENQAGKTIAVIERQVKEGFKELNPNEMKDVIIAYEPIWAIGTGMTATPEVANDIHGNVIRPIVREMFGEDVSQGVRILYGGSVKPGNAYELFAQPEIDGGLVGGASLKVNDFVAIIDAAQKIG